MKIRTKKVLSLLLAASMVFSMNTIAFGDEIVAEEAVVTEAPAQEEGKTAASSQYKDAMDYGLGGVMLDKEDKCATTLELTAKDDKKKSPKNLAVIKNTSNPTSWNNLYGRALFDTILHADATTDDYLNNTKTITVSQASSPEDAKNYSTIEGYPTEMSVLDDANGFDGGEYFESIPVDTENGIYALVGYHFLANRYDSNGYVTGNYKYNSTTDMPGDAAKNSGARVSGIPLATWNGGTVGLAKNGKVNISAKKENTLEVVASLVEYKDGNVTELEQLAVTSLKWKDKKALKQASVELATSPAVLNGEDNGKWVVNEHKIVNNGIIPEFSVNAKAKLKKAKKYKKALAKALKGKTFKIGIVQKGIKVIDPTEDYSNAIANYFMGTQANLNKYVTGTTPTVDNLTGKTIAAASANDGEELAKTLDNAFMSDGYVESTADLNALQYGGYHSMGGSGLKVSKFKSAKTSLVFTKDIIKNNKDVNKKATVKLGKKEGVKFEKQTLGGDKEVYVLSLEGPNYVYANTAPTVGGDDLSAFGYKYAFRKDPKDSKDFRGGIWAATNTGFVYSAK